MRIVMKNRAMRIFLTLFVLVISGSAYSQTAIESNEGFQFGKEEKSINTNSNSSKEIFQHKNAAKDFQFTSTSEVKGGEVNEESEATQRRKKVLSEITFGKEPEQVEVKLEPSNKKK
jgi:hypothetical protein